MKFWWHSDVVRLQNKLKTGITTTNTAVMASTKLDAATRAAWTAWYTNTLDFCDSDAAWIDTGSDADEGQRLERELVDWQHKLIGGGVVIPGALYTSPDGKPFIDSDMEKTIRYIAVGAGILGTAYIVGEIMPHIPYAAPKAVRGVKEGHRRAIRLAARTPRMLSTSKARR